MSNSMGPDQTKQPSSPIWVQTSPICQLHPYVKQHGSRSDQTLAEPDLGPNYLKKFTSTSCQLHPYVKQHGFRSDQTIVEPKPDPNYLQNITPTSCQLFAKVHSNFLTDTSLCQTAWVKIRPNNCHARSGSKLFAKVHLNSLSVASLCQTAWVQTRPNSHQAPSGFKQAQSVSYILMSNSMGPDQTKHLPSLIWVQTI